MKYPALFLTTVACLFISDNALAQFFPDKALGYYRQNAGIAENSNCNNPTFNSIAIKRKTPTLAFVAIDTLKCDYDADRCQFYGVGRWKNNKIIASAPGSGGKICRITLAANGSSVKILSLDNNCDSMDFCAFGGSLMYRGVFRRFRRR